MSDTRRVSIGPNVFFIPGTLLGSFTFWCGVALAVFRFSHKVQYWVLRCAYDRTIQTQVVRFYSWLVHLPFPLWLAVIAVAVGVAIVRYRTSSYYISENRDLIVNTGLLGWGTPRGPLIVFANTIAGRLITDVNVSRNLLQLMFGTGTLVITYSEYEGSRVHAHVISLPYVNRPHEHANTLMSGAGVSDLRMLQYNGIGRGNE